MEIKNFQCDSGSLTAIIAMVLMSVILIGSISFHQGVREGELKFYREHDKTRN